MTPAAQWRPGTSSATPLDRHAAAGKRGRRSATPSARRARTTTPAVNLTNSFSIGFEGAQLRQGSGGLPGTPRSGDRFGHAMEFVLAQIGTNPADEEAIPLLISAPGDKVSGHAGAGSVLTTWVGSRLSKRGPSRLITQDTAGIPRQGRGRRRLRLQSGSQHPDRPRPSGSVPDRDRLSRGGCGSAADAGSLTVLKNQTGQSAHLHPEHGGDRRNCRGRRSVRPVARFRHRRSLVIGVAGEDRRPSRRCRQRSDLAGWVSRTSPRRVPSLTEDSPGTGCCADRHPVRQHRDRSVHDRRSSAPQPARVRGGRVCDLQSVPERWVRSLWSPMTRPSSRIPGSPAPVASAGSAYGSGWPLDKARRHRPADCRRSNPNRPFDRLRTR